MSKAYLLLADGTVYTGESIGAAGETIGEAVFTTAMCGYMETLTDPSYYGQIVTQTFPMIGNYGEIFADAESKRSYVAGYIVRELCSDGSNFRKEGELNDFLTAQNIVGICGIDTRALTRKIREGGVIGAMICRDLNDLDGKLARIRSFKIKGALKNTSVETSTTVGKGRRVVLWDFGAKQNIERELVKRGCEVVRVPFDATAEQILAYKPAGIMLSNGGGDPAENTGVIEQIRKLFAYKIPSFGICLGHQLMCLAAGGKTKKMKYGHRGVNQPVKDLDTGRVYITSQNHGYAVVSKSLPENVRLRMVNANDKTCEGVDFTDIPAFTVQFHPEACGGPHDTEFLFDRFVSLMDGEVRNA